MKAPHDRRVDGRLERIPCVVMRGGTSRAVVFHERDLPTDPDRRDRVLLSVMGSPHPRQIDGLGGADTLTSKIAIVSASVDPTVDVEYTFGQVHIERPSIDYSVSCGNIASAIGYYAIEAGLVDPVEPTTTVAIRDANTGARLRTEVPVHDGATESIGEYELCGVSGTGASVEVGFLNPGGETTGTALFPTGSRRDTTTVDGEPIEYTYVDAGNPYVFVAADSFGCDGTELPADIDPDEQLTAHIDALRATLAAESGLAADRTDALENKTVLPAVVLVAPPTEYTDYEGVAVDSTTISLCCRLVVNRRLHKAFAGTGIVSVGMASQIQGTVVEAVTRPFERDNGSVRIVVGHPSGTMGARVVLDDEMPTEVHFRRTARRIMDGVAYAYPVAKTD